MRGKCRPKGLGWRLDSFIVSERWANKVKQCEIRQTIYGASDHVPVVSFSLIVSIEGKHKNRNHLLTQCIYRFFPPQICDIEGPL